MREPIYELHHDPATAQWLLSRWDEVQSRWVVEARLDSSAVEFLRGRLAKA